MGSKGSLTRDNLLTPDELQRVRSLKLHLPERFLITVLMYTGMRISEVLHLKRSWIDTAGTMIRIPERQRCGCYDCNRIYKLTRKDGSTVERSKGGYWTPKTSHGVRVIPMLPGTFPELRTVMLEYFKRYSSVHETLKNRPNCWYIISKVRKEAGIRHHLFAHAFRGTYAKNVAGWEDVDVFELKDLMGWKDIKEAANYIRISGEELRRKMQKSAKRF